MADKFPSTVNAFINFVAGEQPSADKFNALVAQTKYGLAGLEVAIGDIHNASWPYVADGIGSSSNRLTIPFYRNWRTGNAVANADANGRSLDIANLARLIGPASNLNPLILDADAAITITGEQIGSSGSRQDTLRYPPSDLGVVFSGDSTNAFLVRKTSVGNVEQDGDYFISNIGTIHTFSGMGADVTATYETDPMEWGCGPNYPHARFNVIPDPNQVDSSSTDIVVVTTAGADGLHVVQLPIITHQQSNKTAKSAALAAFSDPNYQVQAKLPFVLTENLTTGQTIPGGFLYLKNVTTNEVYVDATYIYNDENTFQVGNVELDSRVAAGDVWQVLTVGTDITSAIFDLQYKFFNHTHDKDYGGKKVHADQIGGKYSSPGDSGVFLPSGMPINYFPQYLHRDGYRPDSESTIVNDGNALRGNLVFGLVNSSPGKYVLYDNGHTSNASGCDTFGICFGGNPGAASPTNTRGPVIRGDTNGNTSIDLYISGQNDGVGDVTLRSYSELLIDSDADCTFRVGTAGVGSFFTYIEEAYNITSGTGTTIHAGAALNLTGVTSALLMSNQHMTIQSATNMKIESLGGEIEIFTDWNSNNDACPVGIYGSATKGSDNPLFKVRGNNATANQLVKFINEDTISGDVLTLESRWLDPTYGGRWWVACTTNGYQQGGLIQSYGDPGSATRAVVDNLHGGQKQLGGTLNGCVQFVSGQYDVAEWIECGNLAEWEDMFTVEDYTQYTTDLKEKNRSILALPEGLLVYVRRDENRESLSQFYRSGPGRPMIITNSAMLVGNRIFTLEDGTKLIGENISFIGQVPTVVRGACSSGDLIVPDVDNKCRAVPVDEATFQEYKLAVGTALGSSDTDGSSYVVTAIGVK